MSSIEKIYIGIDPDLRLLNAAIIVPDPKPRLVQVFIRRNKEGSGDTAVANAARMANKLVEDVFAYFVAEEELQSKQVVIVTESQNVQYTGHTNQARKQNVLQVAQVAGCLLGAFSNMCDNLVLVQPSTWKGQVPKDIHHCRIYGKLLILSGHIYGIKPHAKNEYPAGWEDFNRWSGDEINPGDFSDINDSIGLALYGAENKL